MKKYEFDGTKIITVNGLVLNRIRAIRNFGQVKAGEYGGYIESENNLSHEGKCWVFPESRVYGDAWVSDNALIYNSTITDNAWINGRVEIINTKISSGSVVGL